MATPTKAEARAHPPAELRDLLAAIEPAVLAVQTAEQRVKQAAETSKRIMSDANQTRDAAIRRADAIKQAAIATFDAAVESATKGHAAITVKAQRALDDAKRQYAEACETADPLLQALREKTERVATVAHRASERPWER